MLPLTWRFSYPPTIRQNFVSIATLPCRAPLSRVLTFRELTKCTSQRNICRQMIDNDLWCDVGGEGLKHDDATIERPLPNHKKPMVITWGILG